MAPKNKKAEKMSLGDFLGDQSLGSWADEMEDAPMPRAGGGFGGASYGGGSDRPSYGGGSGFGARTDSFADRGFATREQLPLPSKPPYTAHLGNLSFDATEGDVQDFFAECEVTNVRIVEDKLDRKPKGFGYVEFGSLDGLKKALDLSGTSFQGRNVRVSVAEPPKDRPEARDISDWSRKGPLPDLPNQRRGPERGYSSRGFDAGASDAGSDRGERRRPAFESDGKQRDFGNWERKGPLSPSAEAPREGGRRFDGPREPREGGFRERQAPGWGEGRPEGERGPPRREFQPAEGRPQYERQPTAADQDNQWRSKMRADAASPSGTPEASTPSSPAPLASRPKLNLAKRTVSEAPAASPSNPSDKPNPFGAARPIDTAAREREVEEKQKQAAQQKKEAEDKAREEKKAKEAAAKEAASAKPESDDVPETVENPEAEAKDEDANGEIVDDKEVKPQEPVVAPKDGGSWRRKSSTPAAAPAETTTQTMDEDGWSTVTKAPKSTRNNRRGGAPTRALAS